MDSANRLAWWRLRRTVRTMRWPAAVGILLLAFAAAFYVANVRPLQTEVAALRVRVQQARVQAPSNQKVVEPQQSNAQLLAFYEALPNVRQSPAVLTRLHAHARAVGLVLDRGEYRPLPDNSRKLVRYQIVLPVTGSYPQLRDFVAGAMRDTPGLALDGLSVQRDRGDSRVLEAQLQFTVFLRAET